MVVNQLFNEKPSLEFVTKFVKCFGLTDLQDDKYFTLLDIQHHNTLTQIHSLLKELYDLYLPCKYQYITNINAKSSITILRQLLKVYDYDVFSHEKFIKGVKYLEYKVISKNEKKILKKPPKKKKEFIIHFD